MYMKSRSMSFLIILFVLISLIKPVSANTSDSEIELARNFMIEMYSSKIQDHVLLIFAVVGAWYTFLKNISKSGPLSNIMLKSIIYAGLVWISIYSFGRLVYWSQYNSILLTVEPLVKLEAPPDGFKDNLIWSFHEAVLLRIRAQPPYINSDRTINIKLANFMARRWITNLGIHVFALVAFYTSYYWQNIQQKLEKYSQIVTTLLLLAPVFVFTVLCIIYRISGY
jgi:hypothetical protein